LVIAFFGLAALAVFASLCPDALSSGDPAVYLDQMASHQFGGRTVHLGYLWLGAAYVSVFPATDLSLNLLHAVLGAVAVMLVGGITAQLTDRPATVGAACLTALVHLMVMNGATHAEVYVPQCVFLLAACLLAMRPSPGRPALLLIAVFLAMAVLITPSSLFLVPTLALLRPKLRDLILIFSLGALLTVLALSGSWDDYLLSPRGLLEVGEGIDLMTALQKEVYELFRGFGPLLAFLLAGVVAGLKRGVTDANSPLRRRFVVAVATLFVVNLVIGERFPDVPVQLPAYFLAMVLVALGVEWLPSLFDRLSVRRHRLSVSIVGAAVALVPMAALIAARPHSRPLSALPGPLMPVLAAVVAVAFAASAFYLVVTRPPAGQPRQTQPVIFILFLVCALATGSISIFWVIGENHEMLALKQNLIALEQQVPAETILVSTWTQGILFEHYTGREIYSGVFVDDRSLRIEPTMLDEVRADVVARFDRQLLEKAPVLVMTESTEALERLRESGYSSRPVAGYSYFTHGDR
jgi:hypothetical protein